MYDSDRGRHGRDCIVVGFTTNYTISAYHHERCEFESRLWRAVLDATLCDKVCQWNAAGRWFSTCTLVIALTITIIFLNVHFLLFQLFSFYFLLNWYFVRKINFASSYSIISRNNASIAGQFALGSFALKVGT